MKFRKIVVLLGGLSSEREVSTTSTVARSRGTSPSELARSISTRAIVVSPSSMRSLLTPTRAPLGSFARSRLAKPAHASSSSMYPQAC